MSKAPNLPTNSELRKLVDNANAPIFGIDVDGKVNVPIISLLLLLERPIDF